MKRDSTEYTMFHLAGHAETFVFPTLSMVRHGDSWVRRRGSHRCFSWHLPSTLLKGLFSQGFSKVPNTGPAKIKFKLMQHDSPLEIFCALLHQEFHSHLFNFLMPALWAGGNLVIMINFSTNLCQQVSGSAPSDPRELTY